MSYKEINFVSGNDKTRVPGLLRIALLAVAAMLQATPIFAQNSSAGEIRGIVRDSTGAVIPGAVVRLRHVETNIVVEKNTNAAGVFDAPELELGTYSISIAKPGFKTYTVNDIALHVETVTANALLEVGQASEVVAVRADAQQLETETSDLNTTLTPESLSELPQVGNAWFDLTGLLPGINPGMMAATNSQGGREIGAEGQSIAVNGSGAYQSNWMLDGAMTTSAVSQESGFATPDDAIAEVDLKTGTMSAEYGNGTSAFNVITKSGSNKFHGSAFEYNENTVFEARQAFTPSSQPVSPLHWNLYGGTLGGPIIRNKAFFFFSFQRNANNFNTNVFSTVPTQAMMSGDFSGFPMTIYDPATTQCSGSGTSQICTRQPFPGNQIPAQRIDPVAAKMQAYFAPLNVPSNGLSNNSYFSAPSPTDTNWYNVRGDYNFSAADRLTLTFQHIQQEAPNPQPYLWAEEPGVLAQTVGQVTNTWTISPTALNEMRLSYFLENEVWPVVGADKGYEAKLGLQNLPLDDMPALTIGGYVPTGWSAEPYPSGLYFGTLTPSDTFTLVKGRHTLKFGGEFDVYHDNNAWAYINSGAFNFSGVYTADPNVNAADYGAPTLGYADFLLGDVSSWNASYSPQYKARMHTFEAFVQDDFKVTSKLTLNLGLRWEIQPGWTEVHNHLGSFDPNLENPATGTLGAIWYAGQHGRNALQQTKYGGFGPRVGFAWSPRQNTAVRAGFGIFQTMWGANNYLQGSGIDINTNQALTDFSGLTPVFALHDSNPPIVPNPTPPSPSFFNGQSISYMPYNTPLGYVEQWQVGVQQNLPSNIQLDIAYVGSKGTHILSDVGMNQATPAIVAQYGAAAENMRPYPQYQGIQAYYFGGWSNYHSLQLKFHKSLTHGLNVQSSYTFAKALDTGTMTGWGGNIDFFQNGGIQNAYDIRANYGRNMSDIRHLWNGGAIYQLPFGKNKPFINQGGLADSIFGGWQLSNIWQVHSGMPFTPLWAGEYINYSETTGGIHPNRICNGKMSHPMISGWFDTACFTGPANGTFGNSGRDILSGPDFWNMDATVSKSWRVTHLPYVGENATLQFKADADNVFNHVQYMNPAANIGAANQGLVQAAYPPRLMEMGLKLKF